MNGRQPSDSREKVTIKREDQEWKIEDEFPLIRNSKSVKRRISSPPPEKLTAAHTLIDKFENDCVNRRSPKTLDKGGGVRLDYQDFRRDEDFFYADLQIQHGKQSIACAHIEITHKFGRDLIRMALRKSLNDKNKWRLSKNKAA